MHSRFTLERVQEGARLPGTGRAAHAASATAHGIDVPDEMVIELLALAYPG
jgi:LDH2 family malate/lactate/ureidoglycolate dehydrogenase